MKRSDDTSNENQRDLVMRTPTRRVRLDLNGIHKHLGFRKQPNVSETVSSNANYQSMINKPSSFIDVNEQDRNSVSEFVSLPKQPEHPFVDADHKNKLSAFSVTSVSNGSGEESLEMDELSPDVESARMLEEYDLPTSFGKREPSQSRKKKYIKSCLNDGGSYGKKYLKNKIFTPVEVFDICKSEVDVLRPPTPSDLFDDAREPLMNQLNAKSRQLVLKPGMILLKSYISLKEQVSIVQKCRKLGIGPGGFYQPGYETGAKLRLYMMCLGLDWDPQTRKYLKRRRIDRSKPPDIPPELLSLVDRAMLDSHVLIKRDNKVCNAEHILPKMTPDVCIVNYYTETGRLGLHQDRDETTESLAKQLPVVSFSIGDSAEFLYGDRRDTNKAETLILESGDVLIFGGESRHIFHGVASIIPDSAPRALLEETGLCPGRVNLTFRQNYVASKDLTSQ
ncbi:uncharacterized protein LOC130814180 isoform X2 [Amaranthus tricolor]|nr:uncharacterized protein LOC130814180 isoform X2 [Amaranthus tricolor]